MCAIEGNTGPIASTGASPLTATTGCSHIEGYRHYRGTTTAVVGMDIKSVTLSIVKHRDWNTSAGSKRLPIRSTGAGTRVVLARRDARHPVDTTVRYFSYCQGRLSVAMAESRDAANLTDIDACCEMEYAALFWQT